MTDDDMLNLAYRGAYDAAYDLLRGGWCGAGRWTGEDPAELRALVVKGLRYTPEKLADPRTAEAITEGVEDAVAKRRPRW